MLLFLFLVVHNLLEQRGERVHAHRAKIAVRAVARSCAANPVSLAVPCHRVVGSDGSLTGYRWGIPRKRELLAQEAKQAAGRPTRP